MFHTVRLAGVLTATLLLGTTGAATAASSPPHANRPAGSHTQQLAQLTHSAEAFSSPSRSSRPVGTVSRTRPITGEQTALPVIAHATDAHHAAWLKVLLPGRPNGHTGWISTRWTTPAVTGWQITVRLSPREVIVLRDGHVARRFKGVVGKPSTPTPLGRFFVEETVALSRSEVGAPYALALSARSNVLQEFAGGPGQIALHGTDNVGGVPGTAASHGCVRLDTQAITWLGTRIGPGTPVTIAR